MAKLLNEYKAVFIDFDDTLCVRLVHEGNPEYYKKMLIGDKNYYINEAVFMPGVGCRNLLRKLRTADVYCLTWADSDIVKTPKKAFIDFYFCGMIKDIIITGTREGKVKFMEMYADVNDIKHEDILLVDDHPDTRREAFNKGFGIMSASEVAVRYSE